MPCLLVFLLHVDFNFRLPVAISWQQRKVLTFIVYIKSINSLNAFFFVIKHFGDVLVPVLFKTFISRDISVPNCKNRSYQIFLNLLYRIQQFSKVLIFGGVPGVAQFIVGHKETGSQSVICLTLSLILWNQQETKQI